MQNNVRSFIDFFVGYCLAELIIWGTKKFRTYLKEHKEKLENGKN